MPDPDCKDCFGTGCCCGGIGYTHWSDEICCGCVDPNQKEDNDGPTDF